jgi:hypothetical protein
MPALGNSINPNDLNQLRLSFNRASVRCPRDWERPTLRTELLPTASARPRSSTPARNVHRQVTSLAVRFVVLLPPGTAIISNSTDCPSCNVPLHDAESALAATNISSPLALCRKPIFFSALYHLTTPVVRPASAGVARTAIVNKTENVLNIALSIDRLPISRFNRAAY